MKKFRVHVVSLVLLVGLTSIGAGKSSDHKGLNSTQIGTSRAAALRKRLACCDGQHPGRRRRPGSTANAAARGTKTADKTAVVRPAGSECGTDRWRRPGSLADAAAEVRRRRGSSAATDAIARSPKTPNKTTIFRPARPECGTDGRRRPGSFADAAAEVRRRRGSGAATDAFAEIRGWRRSSSIAHAAAEVCRRRGSGTTADAVA